MLLIGLTGGIASGKSTVLDAFARLGVPTLDADHIAAQLTEPGQPCLEQIARRFGEAVLTPAGELDRRAMRARIFASDEARQNLEAILHPAVAKRITLEVARWRAPYGMVCIPLLIEAGYVGEVDRILVVDVPESIQIQRVIQRDQIDAQQARQILAAQISRQARLEHADEVLDNSDAITGLAARIQALHQRYLQLSQA